MSEKQPTFDVVMASWRKAVRDADSLTGFMQHSMGIELDALEEAHQREVAAAEARVWRAATNLHHLHHENLPPNTPASHQHTCGFCCGALMNVKSAEQRAKVQS